MTETEATPPAPTPPPTTTLVKATVHPLPTPAALHSPGPAAQPEPVPTAPQVTAASASAPATAAQVVEGSTATLSPDEVHLTEEVDHLWKTHTAAQGFLKLSRDDAAKTRAALSKHLHELKSVLSRPGRGGAWLSFLKAQAIPRTTADRLVNAPAKTIPGPAGSCPTGASKPEPADVVVRRYLDGLWPKLSRVLTTREHVELFIVELTQMSKKSFGAKSGASSSAVLEGAATTL